MGVGQRILSQTVQDPLLRCVTHNEASGILVALGQSDALLPEFSRRIEISSVLIKRRQSPQNARKLWCVPDLPTQLPGAGIGVFHFRSSPPFGGLECPTQSNVESEFALGTLRRTGESLEHFEPFGEVTDRFHIGRALDGFLTRPLPVTYGVCMESRFRVVLR